MNTKVLVVEDDLEINELLGEYLALESIKYMQATTGQAGIHQATTQHPDAVILDLMLPDIDGFEVARTLSMHRSTYDIPIVILSCMCQECDREKGFAAGALFYMNKPFLPDDLLGTVSQALEWRATLQTRIPEGTIALGGKDVTEASQAVHQMVADLFSRTDLSDAVVAQIREAVETLDQWARQWKAEHPGSNPQSVLEYKIGTGGQNNSTATVDWKVSETAPGMLADAFFKPVNASSGGAAGGGIIGWGASTLMSKPLAPIAPPAKWLQVLAKTGAAKFEKDTKAKTVRFSRVAGATSVNGGVGSGGGGSGGVPVVEIDGMRIPTRLRDEALAAKRK